MRYEEWQIAGVDSSHPVTIDTFIKSKTIKLTGDGVTDSATIIITIVLSTRQPHQIGFIATNIMIVLLYDGPSLMVSQSK